MGCLEDKQPDNSTDEKQQNRICFLGFGEIEGTQKECYAGSESKWIVGWRTEILFIHQKYGCSSYQSDDRRTESGKDILHDLGILMGHQITADENHDDEGQPHDGEGCQEGTRPGCPGRITCMKTGSIAHVGGTVDADRSRS